MQGKSPTPQQVTITGLLDASKRPSRVVPIRRSFVQSGQQDEPVHGPLHSMVRHHDPRAFDLYLLHRALVSSEPWVSRAMPAVVWARALAVDSDADGGKATVSKAWARLENEYGLIERRRDGRRGVYAALKEDGSGDPYDAPDGTASDPYLTIPFQYWTSEEQWYRTLSMPAKAMLIVASTLGKNFSLPFDKVPSWYGISEETASRGMRELKNKGLMSSTSKMKHTPLEETITTREYRYSLVAPFGRRSTHASATPTLATVTPLTVAAGS